MRVVPSEEDSLRIAVISDLHLGRRDTVDHFGHEDSSFLRFLCFLESEFERIVLLGDIYETLTSRAPYQQVAELAAARAAHPEIVRRFSSPKYQYIHGNHDLITARTEAAPEQWVLEADGVRLLFTHGHAHDWIIRRARFISEWGVWLGAWLRRGGMHCVFRAFDQWDAALRGAEEDPTRCTFQRWALSRAHEHQADVVVTGHTHLGTRAEHGDRLFLNSGTCSEGNFSFLALDTQRGQYSLHQRW
ncbi:metallophosphoesterase family protein [Hyalangium versicolor]|uniref:metallophosphoesterase family protein n=1 Tax=Hyalangium versicolor TaxID=2861190 RepID=UPI001CC98C7C|nr:metallophosphoesterase family protein [Hyalangium versicolor]